MQQQHTHPGGGYVDVGTQIRADVYELGAEALVESGGLRGAMRRHPELRFEIAVAYLQSCGIEYGYERAILDLVIAAAEADRDLALADYLARAEVRNDC